MTEARHLRYLAVAALALSLSACIPPGRDYSWPKHDAANDAAPPTLETDPAILAQSRNTTVGGLSAQPTWEAQPVTPNAGTITDGYYTVQSGDTLRGIANKTGAGSQIIAEENNLTSPYIIKPGQRLKITGGRYHTVGAGETGIAIARAYGAPWREVVALNNLEEPYILRVGQKLLLPASAPAQPANMNLEQRAAAFELDIDDLVTGSQPALASNETPVPADSGPSDWRKTIAPEQAVAKNTAKAVEVPAAFAGRFDWPVAGRLLSTFGSNAGGRINDGLNIAIPNGTPVRAAADGVVAYAGDEIGVFGGLVLINHGSGWVTAYGHASKLNVTRGQSVKMGDIIAEAGESGYVQEPQLHFEIRKNRKPVDPITQLPKRS